MVNRLKILTLAALACVAAGGASAQDGGPLRGMRIGMTKSEFIDAAHRLSNVAATSVSGQYRKSISESDHLEIQIESGPDGMPSVQGCMAFERERHEQRNREERGILDPKFRTDPNGLIRNPHLRINPNIFRTVVPRRFDEEEELRKCKARGALVTGESFELAYAHFVDDRLAKLEFTETFVYSAAGYNADAAGTSPSEIVEALGKRMGISFVSGTGRGAVTSGGGAICARDIAAEACISLPPSHGYQDVGYWEVVYPPCNCKVAINTENWADGRPLRNRITAIRLVPVPVVHQKEPGEMTF